MENFCPTCINKTPLEVKATIWKGFNRSLTRIQIIQYMKSLSAGESDTSGTDKQMNILYEYFICPSRTPGSIFCHLGESYCQVSVALSLRPEWLSKGWLSFKSLKLAYRRETLFFKMGGRRQVRSVPMAVFHITTCTCNSQRSCVVPAATQSVLLVSRAGIHTAKIYEILADVSKTAFQRWMFLFRFFIVFVSTDEAPECGEN